MRARRQHIGRTVPAIVACWLAAFGTGCQCGDDLCGWMEVGRDYEIEVLATEDDRVQRLSCGDTFDLMVGTAFALRNIVKGELDGDGHNCAYDCFSVRAELDLEGIELLDDRLGDSAGYYRVRVGACTGKYKISISSMDHNQHSFSEGAPSNFLLTRWFSADDGSCAMDCQDDFWVRITDTMGVQISEDLEP